MIRQQRCYRNIFGTLNNPTKTGQEQLEYWKAELPVVFVVFQKERVTTTHYQFYMEFEKQVTHKKLVQLMEGAHFEPRRGTPQDAFKYCTKDESRLEGPWQYGELSHPGKRTDIEEAIDAALTGNLRDAVEMYKPVFAKYNKGIQYVYDILKAPPVGEREIEVTLLYGPGGCGKNHTVRTLEGFEQVYEVDASLNFREPYSYQRVLFIDEFCGSKSGARPEVLNKALDKWPYQLPQLYAGTRSAAWTKVYIATNIHPRMWYDWYPDNGRYYPFIRRINKILAWNFNDKTPRVPDQTIIEKAAIEAFLT